MLEPTDGDADDYPSPYRDASTPGIQHGEDTTCELCGKYRRCFERCGLTACQTCQDDFLPSKGLL
jgi:hypothetical protein